MRIATPVTRSLVRNDSIGASARVRGRFVKRPYGRGRESARISGGASPSPTAETERRRGTAGDRRSPLRGLCLPRARGRWPRRGRMRSPRSGRDLSRDRGRGKPLPYGGRRHGPRGFVPNGGGRHHILLASPAAGKRGAKSLKKEKSLIFPQKTLDPGKTLCYNPFYLSDERFLFARFFPRAQGFPGVQTGRQCP